MDDRTCSVCGESKPLDEFRKDKRKPGGRGYRCKPCESARVQASEAYRRYQSQRDPASKYRWYDRTCETCGSLWRTRNAEGRFCSLYCRDFEARQKRMPVHVGPSLVTHLPPQHPARQPKRPGSWWTLFVSGTCGWCGDTFTTAASCWEARARYCSKRCTKNAARAAHGGRFRIAPVIRLAIYERDGWVCQLCEDPVDPDLHTSDPWAATLDHIVPQSWSLVPDHRPENLRLAHRWCNSVRSDESYYDESLLKVG